MKMSSTPASRIHPFASKRLGQGIFFSIIIIAMILSSGQVYAQGVGISESSITPDASAILELRSTLRGFLPPRLSSGERDAIATPVTGLFLYNTTSNRYNYRNGSWIALVSASDDLSVLSSSTSVQLSTLLSDETGSGLSVFSTGATLTGTVLAAGTPTVDPLRFMSGSNLTAAAPGAVEFDGKTFYTSTAGGRGVSPSVQIATIETNFGLTNATGVQSCFTATHDVLTVQGNTTYLIEGQYLIGNGATTHTTAMAYALGGGASVTSFEYTTMLWSSALNTIVTAQSTTQVSGVASKVLNATSTAVTTTIRFFGIARINAGGTITPQIAFSAAPGGTNQMKVGSYIKFTPIGDGSVAAVGAWN